MEIKFTNKCNSLKTVVVGIFEEKGLKGQAASLNEKSEGVIEKTLKAKNFKGAKGKFIYITAKDSQLCEGSDCCAAEQIVVAGLGKEENFDVKTAQSIGGMLQNYLDKEQFSQAVCVLDLVEDYVLDIAFGAKLRSYRFDKYKTKQDDEAKPKLDLLAFKVANAEEKQQDFSSYNEVAEGVFLARDLMNEPANIIYPETLAKECEKLSEYGVEVEILGEKEMEELGMGALLGVGQGSIRESKLAIMKYNGGEGQPIAFVGKGVTFDTGGISIKPSANMGEMKGDMGGSAAVVGTMRALAGRKAKINAVGVVGLVENMPSGSAQRPGDIVKSMSGQTIEVLNTDAEGRLVLADALYYTENKYKPKVIIDFATLTGAIVICLADKMGGLFSNNDELADKIFEAGQESGEPVWRLPLNDDYDKMMDSKIADVQNISDERGAGSTTAAQFLQRFISGETPWAHLDIAGVDWIKKDRDTIPTGSVGFGVRLANELVKKNFES